MESRDHLAHAPRNFCGNWELLDDSQKPCISRLVEGEVEVLTNLGGAGSKTLPKYRRQSVGPSAAVDRK